MNILELLSESLNKEASKITEIIFNEFKEKSNEGTKNISFPIGKYFNLKNNDVSFEFVKNVSAEEQGRTRFSVSKPFPNTPIVISIFGNNEYIKNTLNHEVNHVINHLRSKGKATTESGFRSTRKIKNNPINVDKMFSKESLEYIKDIEEMNSFYNQFANQLKEKEFKNLNEIITFLMANNSKPLKNLIVYYLNFNKETKKYFLKRFYKDGILSK